MSNFWAIVLGSLGFLFANSRWLSGLPEELPNTTGFVIEDVPGSFAQLGIDLDTQLTVLARGFKWAEGPVWRHDPPTLFFSDVKRNALFAYSPTEGLSQVSASSGCFGSDRCQKLIEPGSNGLAIDPVTGSLVACQHGMRRVVMFAGDQEVVLASHYGGKRLNSPNDLVFSKDGDLFFTDPSYGLNGKENDPERELSFNGVYRVSRKTIDLVLKGSPILPPLERVDVGPRVNRPNGIAIKDSLLYISNSNASDAFWTVCNLGTHGAVSGCREFASAKPWQGTGLLGSADGLKIDERGNVWATGPGGVHIFSPQGQHYGSLATTVKTGNLAFGEHGDVFICADTMLMHIRRRLQ